MQNASDRSGGLRDGERHLSRLPVWRPCYGVITSRIRSLACAEGDVGQHVRRGPQRNRDCGLMSRARRTCGVMSISYHCAVVPDSIGDEANRNIRLDPADHLVGHFA